jgi:hypothetical protein
MMTVVPMDVYPLIDRSKMPQVDLKALPELLVFLGKQSLRFAAGLVHPSYIKLHQEVDVAKAMAIPPEILKLPVLVATGYFVLDGDHRSYRHYVDNTMVPFIQIEAPFAKAVKALLEFPQTFEIK